LFFVALIFLPLAECNAQQQRSVPDSGGKTNLRRPSELKTPPPDMSFLEFRDLFYIRPRAYPEKEINQTQRLRAYLRLSETRRELKRPHISAGWADSPQSPGGAGPGGCAWYTAGPTNINGRITALAIDPVDPSNLYATSVGGIWRSRDGGRRWQRVSDDFLAAVFASVAVNPASHDEIFAGAGDPDYNSPGPLGIWRSLAGGAPGSWSRVDGGVFSNQVIYRMRIDPFPPNDIYVGASGGVYIGSRIMGGITWSRLANFDAWVTDLVVDFSANPRKIYAGAQSGSANFAKGVWKYDGATWQKRDTGISTTNSRKFALGLSVSNPNVLYAKVESGTNGRLQGVYKTTTGGEPPVGGGNAWTDLPNGLVMDDSIFGGGSGYSWYNSLIEVDPTDPNTAYGAGLSLYRTTNGGTNWTNIWNGTDPSYSYGIHADQHSLIFHPTNSKLLILGNDGGIDRSTDLSTATWHWRDSSHGMVLTEFYKMTSQQATVSLIAGGSQDNGTEITFGNRTWYNPIGCDGADVAVDAADSDTLYGNCNGGLFELANPVPGTPGGGTGITWTMPTNVGGTPPMTADWSLPGAALVAGKNSTTNTVFLLKTSDGKTWSVASPNLPVGANVTYIAIAASSSFQTYYMGIGGSTPTIWRTSNGGGTWQTTATGLPNLQPTSIAVDYSNPLRALASFGGGTGGVYLTTNGGADWTPMPGSGSTALPSIWTTGVALDPNDPNVFYVSTGIGAFRAQITAGAPPTASYVPFDEGMPDGLDLNGIWVNRTTGILSVATMGHGIYQRDIRSGITCPGPMLLVRDNVFDRGAVPSPDNVPDAEHPIADSARPGFYKPDDTSAGRVHWWSSTDIRIDVPSNDPPANTIPDADHVEFESCPTAISPCPAGTLLDSHPERDMAAKAYIQINNRGLQPSSNVRVIALWADATAGLPLLPSDFWATTFPAGSTTCGPLSTATAWSAVDQTNPCRLVTVVNPDLPEVAAFSWNVPSTARDHSCMLVIVESVDDPLPSSIRASNEVRLWVLVPDDRHIGLRNLHVVDPPPTPGPRLIWLNIPNPSREARSVDLVISRPDLLPGSYLEFILPRVSGIKTRSLRQVHSRLSLQQRKLIASNEPKLSASFVAAEREGEILSMPVPPGKTWTIAILVDPGPKAAPGTSSRFTVMARQGKTIIGGSTFVVRTPGKQDHYRGANTIRD
jgi:photosystem II stability/assembly factor-like uncharacterized protein